MPALPDQTPPASRPDSSAQRLSPAYRLAALDQDFLLGDSMRGARFMLEYAKAEEALRAWGVRSTVVMFGSARVRPLGDGEAADERRRRQAGWYEGARALAYRVSLEGGALLDHKTQRDNVVATGGGPGIMEAANRGASEAGAPSIGFNITLPHEQEPNAYSTPELTFNFHYFAMRKMHLAMRAAALVVFPGGYGTLDELFELLTLRQTGKMHPIPIVLYDGGYWRDLIRFETMAEHELIAPADLEMFATADDPDAAFEALVRLGLPLPDAAAVTPLR
jgi:uncharacterized protein (TIGR00730 family)